MSDCPLRALDVRKSFFVGARRIRALDGVSLEVKPGVVTGLIGPDGAGKTTFMRLASGLLAPDGGRIEVLGLDATGDALAVQSRIGYMPQRFGLYEDLSVRENLDLYADLQGVPAADRPARHARLMEMTGLGPFGARLAGQLSGGMKQKLGLACTLVNPPRLLLLDEPTVGVDPVSRRELWAIVDRLVAEEGMSLLLSTAYLDEAQRCAQVVLIHQGRVIDQGPPGRFSAPLRGRTFRVKGAPAGRRRLQARLAALPGVLDAVLQGDAVRVVMAEGARPAVADTADDPVRWEPVEPRFEDGFVALLSQGRDKIELPEIKTAVSRFSGDAIVTEGLTRRFGDFVAVDGLSVAVHAGEVFGLLGANGAGKTTTFRMLCGLLPPSEGRARVAGVDLRHAPAEARARVGYMSQRFSLYTNLSAMQNLNFFARAYGLRGASARDRVAWALDAFGLAELAGAESGSLPLGYKQRLAMAAALMHEPDILFLDEPTSGVDPLARREFWSRINALAEGGVTVLVTTHFMEEAEYCDRLAVMAAGEVLALGTPSEIKARAATPEVPQPDLEQAFITLIEAHA
ncbi:ATP-binding cassette domain-containing protein [Thiocapsa bogorovii]|uniref:ATP-binding cassette domain-containing protein n=1 Tax=Thiocapsa bogorovii TaxID=521689 RepID=UPI001E289D34|nr:ATP-binding cassette domain-containing protein [Thiocapsa bogorovii]UHD15752.1 ATP-binding cassette domain-containing protein [Thiocapsa bogorovii]